MTLSHLTEASQSHQLMIEQLQSNAEGESAGWEDPLSPGGSGSLQASPLILNKINGCRIVKEQSFSRLWV